MASHTQALLATWNTFESWLRPYTPGQFSAERGIAQALSARVISDSDADILNVARRIRNMIVHESTAGRSPIIPDPEFYASFAGLVDRLVNPLQLSQFAAPVATIALTAPAGDAFARLGSESAVPYRDRGEWGVLTRDHVAMWAAAKLNPKTHRLGAAPKTVQDLISETMTLAPLLANPSHSLKAGTDLLWAELAAPTVGVYPVVIAPRGRSHPLILTLDRLGEASARA